jgi:nitroreductase
MELKTKEISTSVEHPVLKVIQDRKSIRAFAPDKIEKDKIESLFEAARWAPSSVNEQPWRYLYASKDQPVLWSKIFEALNEKNKIWVKHVPLLVASFSRTHFSQVHRENTYAVYDLGAANALLALQATALGLQVHQLGGYNAAQLRTNLEIGSEYALGPVLAIGYPGASKNLPEDLQQREYAARVRNKQNEFVLNENF